MVKRSPSQYIVDGYRVRESWRAKRLSIRVSRMAEVEVVVPIGYPKANIPPFLAAKQAWIQRTVRAMDADRKALATASPAALPERLQLRSRSECWQIEYCPGLASHVTLTAPAPCLLRLEGAVDDHRACYDVLRRWVRLQAQKLLPQWLSQISQSIQLPYRRVTIRRQKTIWGSCSGGDRISLNDKLMFVPMPLVRYVLIHELCHTVHMNHSPRFWALVASNEPDYERLKADLRQDGLVYVPPWLGP